MLVGVPTAPGAGVGPVVRYAGRALHAEGEVVVASDLTPADVASFAAAVPAAVVTVAGAPLSHAAILARSLGIPVVLGLGPELMAVPPGTTVLVDGDAGTVRVAPSPEEVEGAHARQRAARQEQDEARRVGAAPAFTRDGCAVPVVANVGGPDDARLAVSEGADGVGMLRTEFAFLGRPGPPSEREQYLAYRAVADAIGERPLVVRTLDLGADVPAWDLDPEPNPALGNRGIRLALARPDLLRTQLTALAQLAQDRAIDVMFPMVTTVDELRRAKAAVPLRAGVGITVEVPAAAVTAELFAPMVDFFAIGTNDLTQYTLATDRGNAAVAALADGLHPAVLRLIGEVTAAGGRHGRPVCVVGELASDPLAVPVLLGLGVASLSVRPNAVAAVKQVVRTVTIDDARALAAAALEAESAVSVRDLVARTSEAGAPRGR